MSTAAPPAAAGRRPAVPRLHLSDWRFGVAIVAIGALMLAVSLRTARQVERDALVINVAGRQRMLVQKATAEYLAGIVAVGAPQEDAPGATARRFEGTLAALTDGGVATFDDRAMLLQPATSRAFRAALEEVGAGWEELRRVLDTHPSDMDGNAAARRLAELRRLTGRTIALMDYAVRVYEMEASARAARLHGIQLALVPLWFGVLGVGLVGERRVRAAQAELREQEVLGRALTRYQELFATVPVGVYRTMPDGTILDANPAMTEMLGFPDRDALMAVPAAGLYVDPADRDRWRAVMEREGVVRGFETQMRRRDGRVIWVRDTARAVRDATARVAAYEGTAEDITERKRAEEALSATSERLQAFVRSSPVAIVNLDPAGLVTLWNPAAERVFGWSEAEILGHPLLAVPDHGRDQHRALCERVLRGEGFSDLELTRLRKDGTPVDVSLSTVPLRDEKGRIIGVLGIMADLGERKRAEQERQRLSTVIEQASDMVMITDAGGDIQYVNPAFERVTG